MRWFITLALLAVSACGTDLPEGLEVECPQGFTLEVGRVENSTYVGYSEVFAASCKDSSYYENILVGVYSRSGKTLYKSRLSRSGYIQEEAFYAHNAKTLSFASKACDGMSLRRSDGSRIWMHFRMECPENKLPPREIEFDGVDQVVFPDNRYRYAPSF